MQLTSFVTLAIATLAVAAPRGARLERDVAGMEDFVPRATSTQSQYTATPVIGCLLPFQATAIVNAFNYLLANPQAPNFSATANALLANDFSDTSDSINQLASIPVSPILSPPKTRHCLNQIPNIILFSLANINLNHRRDQ